MKKKPAAPPTTKLQRNPHLGLRAALIVGVYLIAFILLDFITKQFEELRGVVAWYPPAGLTYTLLLVFGVRFAPAVPIALFISSLFIYNMPQPPYLLLLWALIISLIYTAAVAFLRHKIRIDWQLRKSRDVTWLVGTTVFVSALLAVLTILSSALSSEMPRSEILHAIFVWWIGETVGVLTVTPFLLIHGMPWLKRFAEGQPVRLPVLWSFPRPTLLVIAQAFSMAFILYWVFGSHVLEEFRPIFLITLPLIWIALDHGLKGISAGLMALNFGVMLAIWFFRFNLSGLDELQLLMIVNCIVGLLMGAVVTERRQAEDTLRESEEQYRTLIEQASDGIFISDSEGRYIEVNSAGCYLLGFSREEILQKTIRDLTKVEPTQPLQLAELQQGQTFLREREMIRKDGSRVPVEVSAKQVSDGRVQSIVRDITERKWNEEMLLESELKFRTLFDRALDGILIADLETHRFFLCNDAICQMLGYTHDEMSDIGVDDIHPLEHLPYVIEQFSRQARGEIILAEGLPVMRKDGSVFYANINSTPVSLNGHPYMMGVFHDISARKHAEEEIKKQLEELQRWQSVMMGRESRILDLKREVNELLDKASQPPRYPSAEI